MKVIFMANLWTKFIKFVKNKLFINIFKEKKTFFYNKVIENVSKMGFLMNICGCNLPAIIDIISNLMIFV